MTLRTEDFGYRTFEYRRFWKPNELGTDNLKTENIKDIEDWGHWWQNTLKIWDTPNGGFWGFQISRIFQLKS